MFRRAALACLGLVAACAAPSPSAPVLASPPPPASAPPPAAAASTQPPPVAAIDVYLPPDQAGGWPYCFDPSSSALRAAVRRGRFEETDRLDAAALADDVRALHGAMEHLYAGYPELLESSTFDVDAFFADWERDVRSAGPTIAFGEGVLARLASLRHHIRDNHLSVWGYGGRLARRPDLAFSEYQRRGHVDGFDASRCTFEGAQPIAGTVRAGKAVSRTGLEEIATFSAQSSAPWVDVRCGGEPLRFERRAPHELPHGDKDPVYEWRSVGDASIVVVRRLWGSPAEHTMLDAMAKDYGEHRKKPVIVFDFRGNGGGDDGYVWAWVDRAARGTFPPPYVELRIGSATACGDWNNRVVDQISYDRVDTAEGRAERAAFVAKAPLGGTPGAPSQVLDTSGGEATSKDPYRGRVFVLVDHGSASSGESGPEMLRIALGATIVGERTGGYAEFGNIRPYVMPRTGVVWQLASKRNYYPEPRDGVGFPVDAYLGEDLIGAPVEALVPILEKLPRAAKGRP